MEIAAFKFDGKALFEGAKCRGSQGATSACLICPSPFEPYGGARESTSETEKGHYFFCLEEIAGSIYPFFSHQFGTSRNQSQNQSNMLQVKLSETPVWLIPSEPGMSVFG